jgi:hypothetical protein
VRHPNFRIVFALALTFAALWGLLAWHPFRHMRDVFVNPAQEDAKVTSVSAGQHPLESLRKLESSWCNVPKATRYILSGNSQTFTVLLAPSEAVLTETDRTYPDLLLDRLNATGASVYGYRLSAPNISYMEVLWYLNYLLVL